MCSLRLVAVERADVLGVAARAFERGGIDRHGHSERGDELIVVDVRAALAGERGTRLAQACEHVGVP